MAVENPNPLYPKGIAVYIPGPLHPKILIAMAVENPNPLYPKELPSISLALYTRVHKSWGCILCFFAPTHGAFEYSPRKQGFMFL